MVVRAVFGFTLVVGVEELARFYLIVLTFLGGAVAYGAGQFVGLQVALGRLPLSARPYFEAMVQWLVVVIMLTFAAASVRLQMLNASERSPLLGLGYIWTTVPVLAGCALFIFYAAVRLWSLPLRCIMIAGLVAASGCAGAVYGSEAAWTDDVSFLPIIASVFLGLVVLGVPIGFVLAGTGMLYDILTGSVPFVAIGSTLQRGAGGFIFLALPVFVLAGYLMDKGGIGRRIMDFLTSLFGHFRGGLLQVLIVGMYVVSGMSGSKTADMAAVGITLRDRLRQQGYPMTEAAAALAAAAAMGESVPPSIAILVLSSVTTVSTGALFLGGIVPALGVALSLMALVWFRARVNKMPTGTKVRNSERMRLVRSASLPLLMPVMLVIGVAAGVGTPTEVSSIAVAYGLFLILFIYREMNVCGLWSVLTHTTRLGGTIFFTFSGATLFSSAIVMEGIPTSLQENMAALGPALFLPALIVITILLGALLESVIAIVLLGPLLLPVAVAFGIHPVQYCVVVIEAYGIGSVAPPIGLALYIACSIMRVPVEQTAKPLLAYLGVIIIALLLISFVPVITLALPKAFGLVG